jgi:hypothetical protein
MSNKVKANYILEIFVEKTMSSIAAKETLVLALKKVDDNKEKLNDLYSNQSPPYRV